MKLAKASDAELVLRLQAIKQHGSIGAAARFLGLGRSAMSQSKLDAVSRGLTAETKVVDEVAKLKTDLKLAQTKIRSLAFDADTAETIREKIFDLAAHTPEPPEWLSKAGKPGTRGAPVTVWSDWHYGEVISSDEVGGVNSYNISVAKQRATTLVNTTIDLAYNHMGRAKTAYPGIVICLGGDMMTGNIHEELLGTNDATPQEQINTLTDVLASGIEEMASKL